MPDDRNKEYAGGDPDFAEWLDDVDQFCLRKTGLSIQDLRDYLWRDAFDSGSTPKEAWSDAVCDGIMEL